MAHVKNVLGKLKRVALDRTTIRRKPHECFCQIKHQTDRSSVLVARTVITSVHFEQSFQHRALKKNIVVQNDCGHLPHCSTFEESQVLLSFLTNLAEPGIQTRQSPRHQRPGNSVLFFFKLLLSLPCAPNLSPPHALCLFFTRALIKVTLIVSFMSTWCPLHIGTRHMQLFG